MLQINHKEVQLPQISSNFIYSVEYDTKDKHTNIQVEHTEELKLVFPVEELEKESRYSYALLGKEDANLKVDSGQKFDSHSTTQLNVNQSPHPEYPPFNAHILPTKHVPPSKHELSSEHIMSSNHAASTEHEPSTESVLSKDHAAHAEHDPSTEHVLSSDHAAHPEHEPFIEHVLSSDHAAPSEQEPSIKIRRRAFEVKPVSITLNSLC